MHLLFILLARKGGVGPQSFLGYGIIFGIIVYVIVLHYSLKNTKDIPLAVYVVLFFAPAILLFYKEGYAIVMALGMVCGWIMAYGIYLGRKKPDE